METLINFIRHVFFFVLTRPPFAEKKIIENVGGRRKRVVSRQEACNVEASAAQQ